LEHEIQDLYSAEDQLVDALPKMAKAAKHAALKKAIENHLEETKKQKERLEKVADLLDMKPSGHKCKAMAGLIAEGEEILKEDAEAEVKDAAIIGASQRVEHYEIAGYGTARYYAKMLGENEVAKLLSQTLDEEKGADEKLNNLATEKINEKAMAEN
jgi:ferritin-like metal-binding protein YciE